MDALFSHLVEEAGGRIQPTNVINRIVFPSHRICQQMKSTLDQEFGGFSLDALITEVSDLGDLNELQNAVACIQLCGALGAQISNVTWGYNSLCYRYNGIPVLRPAKELAQILDAPVYYEYFVSDGHKAGAWVVDPGDDDVSFAHAFDHSRWAYFPEGSDYQNDIAVRCGAATVTLAATGDGVTDEQEVEFKDIDNPVMQMLANRGTEATYFSLIEENYSSLADEAGSEDIDTNDYDGPDGPEQSKPEPGQEPTFGQAMGAVTFRIVFPNPECCDFIDRDIEGMYGGFSLRAVCGTPGDTFSSPEEAWRTLTGCGIPDDATDIIWGNNSLRYRVAHSVPNSMALEALADFYRIPLYVEYFDELQQSAGAMIAIPGAKQPVVSLPELTGSENGTYFDRGSQPEAYIALRCGYCQAVSDDGSSRISFVDDPSQPVMAELATAESVGTFMDILKRNGLDRILPDGYDGNPITSNEPEETPKPSKKTSKAKAKKKNASNTADDRKSAIKLWLNPIAEKHTWHSFDAYGQQNGERHDPIMFTLEPLFRNGAKIRDPFGNMGSNLSMPECASHEAHARVLEAVDGTKTATSPLLAALLSNDLLLPEELNAVHRDIELKEQGISGIATGRGTALERRCDSVCYLIAELKKRDGDACRRFMMWMADSDQAMRVKFYGDTPAIGEPFECRLSVVEDDTVTFWQSVEDGKGFTRYKQIPEGGRIDVTDAKNDSAAMTALRKANAMFLKACGLKQTAPSKTRMTPEQAQRFTELREQLDRKTGYALTVLFSRCVLCKSEADRLLDLMVRTAAAHERGEIADVTDAEVMEHKVIYLVDAVSTSDGTCRLYDPNTDRQTTFIFQPHLLEGFHSDLPAPGAMISIATSLVETDVIAAWAGYRPGNAQRTARY